MTGAGAKPFVDSKIRQGIVILFSKRYSPECKQIRKIMDEYKIQNTVYEVVEIENRQDCNQIETYFQTICLTDSRAVPQLFVGEKYVGGEKEILRLHESGRLRQILTDVGAINV